MGRRVQKEVYTYNNGWPTYPDQVQRFVYDGWNVVMVLNHSNEPVYKFTWGLDLSGTLHGAGGIGGLLAAVEEHDPQSSTDDEKFWYFYDGNGNVGQILAIESTSPLVIYRVAHYEYDPYGNAIVIDNRYCDISGDPVGITCPFGNANPFRFSTKWFDPETHLGYWGYRFYSPRLGRWLSRDPIEERGGFNLHAFVSNRPADRCDAKGLSPTPQMQPACCRYAKTVVTWGTAHRGEPLGPYTGETNCEKTEWCSPFVTDPTVCCKCAGSRSTSTPGGWSRRITMTLIGAKWGRCECCTIYSVRVEGESWPSHLGVLLACGDNATKIDFAYNDIYWGITIGQHVDVVEDLNLRIALATYTIVQQMSITKASADAVVAKAKADEANPPDYNIVQDCHWYVRQLFALGEPCDDDTIPRTGD